MIDVLVAGELYTDLILSGFDALPEPGKEIFATRFSREIGGGTAITASGLARLGLRCGVFGVVGKDTGQWMTDRLQEEGIDASQLQFHPTEPTAITVVATTEKDRSFLSYQGANQSLEGMFLQSIQDPSWIAPKHVHLAYAPDPRTAITLFDALHEKGSTVSLDVGWREDWLNSPEAVTILRHVELFFPNLLEGRRITGEETPNDILQRFDRWGVRHVALKLGCDGAALLHQHSISYAEPPKVTPVDTTGAGDCFDAGFLQAWLAGKNPEVCLLQANICGAFSTEGYGGIAAFPPLAKVERELMRLQNA